MAARDRDAANPTSLIDTALQPQRPALVGVSTDRPVKQPKRTPLILGYLLALAVAVAACTIALRAGHKRLPTEAVVAQ